MTPRDQEHDNVFHERPKILAKRGYCGFKITGVKKRYLLKFRMCLKNLSFVAISIFMHLIDYGIKAGRLILELEILVLTTFLLQI